MALLQWTDTLQHRGDGWAAQVATRAAPGTSRSKNRAKRAH